MIEINNLSILSVDKKFLEKIAGRVLERKSSPVISGTTEDKGKKEIEISIALVGERRMRELNKKYRGKNLATDVLSFQYGDSGEIAICPGIVEKNAKNYNSTFKKELARVLIHGILHLLGYDHEKSEKETKKMGEREKYYLNQLEIKN